MQLLPIHKRHLKLKGKMESSFLQKHLLLIFLHIIKHETNLGHLQRKFFLKLCAQNELLEVNLVNLMKYYKNYI